MNSNMKAFVLHSPGNMRLEQRPIPKPGPGEALVKMKSVGICGSDIHYLRHGKIGSFIVNEPMILGHEAAGQVAALGPGTTGLEVGARVVVEPGIPCGTCWFCRNGRYTKCPTVRFMATPPDDGCLVEYVSWPVDFLFEMPDNISFQEGALVEPFAVALYATRRSGLYPAASVAILGAGPIGLSVLEAVKAMGAGDVIVVDVMPNRLTLAKEMGATHVLDAGLVDVVEQVKSLTGGEGAHFVFETAGTAPTFQQTVNIARDGGFVVLLGLAQEDEIPMPMVESVVREINFVSSFRYNNIFEEAITLIGHDRVNLKPLITHEFPFDQALEAFDVAENAEETAVKVMINF